MNVGGGTKQQKTTQETSQQSTTNPWAEQSPYLTQGFQQAATNLANGPYSTTPQTTGAIDAFSNIFGSSPYRQASDINSAVAQGQTGSGYVQGLLGGIASNTNIDQNQQQTLNQLSQGSNLDGVGQDYLRRAASGDYLSQQNPFFQGMVDQSIAAAQPSINANFAAAGRSGSGASAAAFADAATNAATQLGFSNYQQERGYQNQAANSLNSFGLQDASQRAQIANQSIANNLSDNSLRLQGAGALGASQQNDLASRLAAAQNLYGNYGSGISALGQGAALSNVEATRLDPSTALEQFWNIVGSGNYGSQTSGTSTGTGTQPVSSGSGFLSGLGAVGSIAGSAAKLAPYAMMLSDVRAKEGIKRVGLLDNGLPVYSYRYKDGGPTQIGLLAQEVAQSKPDAVGHYGGGLLGVDYDRASQ